MGVGGGRCEQRRKTDGGGGATRIAEHIIKDCACSTTALQELRGKLVAEKWDSDSDSDKSDDEADLVV